MNHSPYNSPAAFKQALEQRLRNSLSPRLSLSRKRQLLVFQRFLARISREFGNRATLKGGMAIELRLDRARTTKDIDLALSGSPTNILAFLKKAVQQDLGDYLSFSIRPDKHHPEIQNEGVQYEGLRFQAECQLAGKIYGERFGVDVVFGDLLSENPEEVSAEDLLGFIGISPPTIRILALETHIAEKLHAYTLPRSRVNSRVKDLPDLALMATVRPIHSSALRDSLERVFRMRKTHELPLSLPKPPHEWVKPYASMAQRDGLPWENLDLVTEAASSFLDPILNRGMIAHWNPETWEWVPVQSSN
ncbi:MAG TPA: nucleotidyl transferase AbiEii/AbiGii toxin family protein [Planctomycetes bacterium]|nr:nucleotidyl transferase AbiEii/AbiGii toxin family protein [Planctomycetota bacterium]